VVAGHVVPLDAVGVEVVQDGQADLIAVAIVRLSSRGFSSSGVRPEASSGAADTLNPAGGPVDNLASMVKAASSPEEPLGKLTGLVHEVFSLLVGVERDSVAAGQLAVLFGLLAGELLARVIGTILTSITVDEPGGNVGLAVPVVVGLHDGAPVDLSARNWSCWAVGYRPRLVKVLRRRLRLELLLWLWLPKLLWLRLWLLRGELLRGLLAKLLWGRLPLAWWGTRGPTPSENHVPHVGKESASLRIYQAKCQAKN